MPKPATVELDAAQAALKAAWPKDAPQLRVVGLESHWPSELRDHPFQWRDHPSDQKTFLSGALKEVGFAGVILIYYPAPDSERWEPTDDESDERGKPIKIDGHLRSSLVNAPLPCIVLDLTDAESDKLIAEYDPIGWLAASNTKMLTNLLTTIDVQNADLKGYFQQLADAHGITININQQDVKKLDEFERFDDKKRGFCCPNCQYEWTGKPRPPLLPPDQRKPLQLTAEAATGGDDDDD